MNKIVIVQLICLCWIYLVKTVVSLSCNYENCAMREPSDRITRKERALLFPSSSTLGVCNFYSFIDSLILQCILHKNNFRFLPHSLFHWTIEKMFLFRTILKPITTVHI